MREIYLPFLYNFSDDENKFESKPLNNFNNSRFFNSHFLAEVKHDKFSNLHIKLKFMRESNYKLSALNEL